MKKNLLLLFFLINFCSVLAQDGFQFNKGIDKAVIPFKSINNLVFIPIKVNGIELNFLLDTGVEETILFSLEEKKEVSFINIEKITLRGLGSDQSIEGLKATSNTLEIEGMKSFNQLLYVILDQGFNLSSHIGIPVNGIIGYQFFKKNLIEINYAKKKIIVYQDNDKNKKRIEKKFDKVPITVEKNKPYVNSTVLLDSVMPVKLLIDIGNSDAIWLFQNRSKNIKVPLKNFDDFLGRGFSGDIEGKRAMISSFSIDKFKFKSPIISFPDSISIKNVKMVKDRVGSVGGEILKRFTVVFDYTNQYMYLRKSHGFYEPFTYNKSGIEIQHNGLQWVQETVALQTVPIKGDTFDSGGNRVKDFKYKFQLKPVYEIANLRKNSPAVNSGLQVGDVLITVNGMAAYKYSLQKIHNFFKSEEEKWITLEIERDSQLLKFKFQLLNIL